MFRALASRATSATHFRVRHRVWIYRPRPPLAPHRRAATADNGPLSADAAADPTDPIHKFLAGLLMAAVAFPIKNIIYRVFELASGARPRSVPLSHGRSSSYDLFIDCEKLF